MMMMKVANFLEAAAWIYTFLRSLLRLHFSLLNLLALAILGCLSGKGPNSSGRERPGMTSTFLIPHHRKLKGSHKLRNLEERLYSEEGNMPRTETSGKYHIAKLRHTEHKLRTVLQYSALVVAHSTQRSHTEQVESLFCMLRNSQQCRVDCFAY